MCGLPAPHRGRAELVPLKVYIDESGDGQPPVLVLAGWIATAAQWASFADEWDKLRRAYRFKVLHMDDAMKFNGEFAGWHTDRRDECVVQAQRIINDHVKGGVAYALPLEPYRRVIQSDVDAPKLTRNSYCYAFFNLIKNMSNDSVSLGIDEPIDFIFDERVKDKHQIFCAWDSFVAHGIEDRIYIGSTPIFADDSRVLPLQAADLAAWCVRATWVARTSGARIALPWLDKNIGLKYLQLYIWDEQNFHNQFQAKMEARGKMMAEFSLGVLSSGC